MDNQYARPDLTKYVFLGLMQFHNSTFLMY